MNKKIFSIINLYIFIIISIISFYMLITTNMILYFYIWLISLCPYCSKKLIEEFNKDINMVQK